MKPLKKNQNIILEGHFWKLLENVLVWAYQVAIRDLKNTNNPIAIDSQLDVLAFFQNVKTHSIKLKFIFFIKMNFFH